MTLILKHTHTHTETRRGEHSSTSLQKPMKSFAGYCSTDPMKSSSGGFEPTDTYMALNMSSKHQLAWKVTFILHS